MFLLFAGLTPLMMLSGAAGDRMHWRRSRRRTAVDYRRRREAADRQVTAALRAETLARRAESPDPVTLALLATTPAVGLWARGREDAMPVRIGTADQPATVRTRSAARAASAGTVRDVPLTLDLRAGPIGLVGPVEVVAGLARWLVAQVAVAHSPADTSLAMLLSPGAAARWQWARWLPHLHGRVGADPADRLELIRELTNRLDSVARQTRLSSRTDLPPPHRIVLVVDAAGQLTDVPGLTTLLRRGPAAGLTAVCIATDARDLPAACTTVVELDGASGTQVVVRPGGARARIDLVDASWADRVARSLAPLVDPAGADAGAVPATCRLLDLLGAADLDVPRVRAGWAGSDGRADTVLGMSVEGPVHLDLAVDGPHLLVAGTTGAGKSELLQSLVTGLAVLHPPDELSFLLVDYKGGAAFAECARLPHTTGLVTDLDPQLTRRALQSLDAELRRRELLFATAGAADLTAYRTSAAAEPIARLVIVVDEFATLADELPDFVRGLVSVAQRGRSLGIHLVLATQRPGSAVSPEIRANTSARIALRVTDPGESSDVIDAPDAATIDRRTPGRAYLRTGAKLVCFQTARAGDVPTPQRSGPVIELLDAWRRLPADQRPDADGDELARVVDVLAAAAVADHRPAPRRAWLAPLPSTLDACDLPPGDADVVPVGLVDLPARQAQLPLLVDLGRPVSMLVVGAPGSGRTGALAALALGAAGTGGPQQLEVYVIDSGTDLTRRLGGLPQLVTSLGPHDGDLIGTLLHRLQATLDRRAATARADAPATLLLVDGWDRLLAGHDDATALRCADLLTALLRTGPAARLTTVVSGDRTLLTAAGRGEFRRAAAPATGRAAGLPAGRRPRRVRSASHAGRPGPAGR